MVFRDLDRIKVSQEARPFISDGARVDSEITMAADGGGSPAAIDDGVY